MKSLVLIRHGKSSWKYDVSDSQRPLQQRGREDAKLVSNQYLGLDKLPDKIFSSPAVRAFSTCKIFLDTFNLSEKSIEIKDDLYDFGGESVINFIKNLPNSYDTVMIFGHNHAFTSIANIYGNKFIENLPTSGLIKLNFEISSWADLKKGSTAFIITPKDLKK